MGITLARRFNNGLPASSQGAGDRRLPKIPGLLALAVLLGRVERCSKMRHTSEVKMFIVRIEAQTICTTLASYIPSGYPAQLDANK